MPRNDSWTPEMYQRLRELYPHHTNEELETLTGWNYNVINYRAQILKLKKTPQLRAMKAGKYVWSAEQEQYMRDNYKLMSNQQLADHLCLKLQFIRAKLYELGLYRMRLEYWTNEQIVFLKDNYRQIGDKELAEIFNTKWDKNKKWSFKHIEKKRLYLKLNRTKDELSAIHDRNVELGRFTNCPVGRWLKYGVSKEGEIRMWRCTNGRYVPFIKVNGKFIHWAKYTWEETYGPVLPGLNVVFKDNDPTKYIEGVDCLMVVTNAELSKRNSVISSTGLSDNYVAAIMTIKNPTLRDAIKQHPEILELKRNELLLNRAIKQQENGRK